MKHRCWAMPGRYSRRLWPALVASVTACAGHAVPPDILNNVQAELERDFSPADNRMLTSMVRRVDVDGDTAPDWRVDWQPTGYAAYCGTGGCRQQVYVGGPAAAHKLAFDAQVADLKFVSTQAGVRMETQLHGTFCGGTGSVACHRSFVWSPTQARFVEARDPVGGTRLTSPLFQPISLTDPEVPSEAKTVRAEQRALCSATGLELDESETPTATRISDINGDDRADWIVGSVYLRCVVPANRADAGPESPPVPGLVVLASSPAGYSRALETNRREYVIDIAVSPAKFITVLDAENCGSLTGSVCPERTYGWNAGTLRFEPAS